jgi:uncharacterized protein YjbJ (UPF0337 family)
MSTVRKAKITVQSAKGKAQQVAGKATGNRKLRAKGTRNRTVAKVKRAGERVREKLR